MPRRIVLWLLCGAFPLSVPAAELMPYEGNPEPPPFVLEDIRGQRHALEDYRDRVLLVNFWASWCPPCIREMPGLQRLQETLADRPFEVLAINVGEPRYKVWKFVRLVDFRLTVLLDTREQTFGSWGVKVLPTSFLLDKAGRVRYSAQGDLEWDSAANLAIIDELLAESPDLDSTRPPTALPILPGRESWTSTAIPRRPVKGESAIHSPEMY